MKIRRVFLVITLLFINVFLSFSQQQQTADELAKKLSNPVSSLISVPFQFNFQFNINPNKHEGYNGYKMLLNFQPVIPFSLTKNWNLINRVIVPVITQKDVTYFDEKEEGIGDILYSAFFSPKKGSFIWGLGPAISFPTATNDYLGTKKLLLGPTVVFLVQPGKWTLGGLFTQTWSVAGSDEREDISSLFAQPILSLGFSGGFTLGIASENSYDWKSERLVSGMIGLTTSQVIKIAGKQTASFGLVPMYFYAAKGMTIPAWGARAIFTLVFPK